MWIVGHYACFSDSKEMAFVNLTFKCHEWASEANFGKPIIIYSLILCVHIYILANHSVMWVCHGHCKGNRISLLLLSCDFNKLCMHIHVCH